MKVLVTGHHGFIGAVMVPTLLDAGHEVVGLDTDLYGDCPFGHASEPDIASIRADIRDVSIDDLTGFDAVVHLAALSNDPLGDLHAELTFDINQHATVRLARLARTAGVGRFLFSSSCSNYGAAGDTLLDEDAAFNPVTPYGESKVRAEAGLSELANDDFSPVLLRSATAYGVSSRLRCDVVLNNLTAWAVATGKVMLKSDGTPWRPIVHIEDICRAFLAALEAPRDAVHNRGVQRGAARRELPDQRARGDRRRDGAGLPDRVRRIEWPRRAELPGRRVTHHRCSAGIPIRKWTRAKVLDSCTRRSASTRSRSTTSKAGATAASVRSTGCSSRSS